MFDKPWESEVSDINSIILVLKEVASYHVGSNSDKFNVLPTFLFYLTSVLNAFIGW